MDPKWALRWLGSVPVWVACTWFVVSHWMSGSNGLNSDSRPLFTDQTLWTWCSSISLLSWSCVMSVCSVVSSTNMHMLSHLYNLVQWRFTILSSSSNSSISWWAAANALLRLSWTAQQLPHPCLQRRSCHSVCKSWWISRLVQASPSG